jgi:probable HAF family extracellular repeat protein
MPASHPHGEIYGMSSGGVMVGMMWNDAGDERAFVFQPGSAVQDLNDLIGSGLGWTLEFARDVNDAGQIVGTGTHNGAVRGFILAPITVLPEISIQDMSVEEGSSGSTTATFTVTLTQP